MNTPTTLHKPTGLGRARLQGAGLLLVAFVLGFGAAWLMLRERSNGMQVLITATDQLPDELVRLRLTAEQRTQAQEVIRRGRDRVLRVVDAFDPAMQAAMDSTDAEVRQLLSAAQRLALDSARKASGPTIRRTRVMKP
jgi:hypothetical protein